MLWLLLLAALAVPAQELSLEMRAEVRVVPPGGPLTLWVPVPTDDTSQWIDLNALQFSAENAEPTLGLRITQGRDGNRYLVAQAEGRRPFTVRYRVPVRRASSGYRGKGELGGLISRAVGKYPIPSLRFPFSRSLEEAIEEGAKASDQAKQTLSAIRQSVAKAGATSLERAIVLNELLRQNGKYIKLGAYGRGNSEWFCLTGQGNCTDFHFTFLDAARALGIAARLRVGIPLKPSQESAIPREGQAAGYHCWLYLEELSFEADPSWESRLEQPTGYYFGQPLNDRLKLTEGSSIILEPGQSGAPLPYLFEAYAEAGGKPLPRYYDQPPAGASGPQVITLYGFRLDEVAAGRPGMK